MRKVVLELTAIDDIYFFGKNDLKLLKKFLNLFLLYPKMRSQELANRKH